MGSNKDTNISKFPGKEPTEKKTNNRKGLYIFSIVILVLIIVTFVGGPLVGSFGSGAAGQRLIFGYYRNRPIEYAPGNYFASQLQMLERQAQQDEMLQQQNPQMQVYTVWRGAFDRTLIHEAILYRAQQSGISVTDEQIDRVIAMNPDFQENGRFSDRLYQRLGAQQQSALRDLTREQLIHQKYLNDVLGYNNVSSQESAFFAGMASPERRIQYVSLSYSNYPESELSSFISERSELFRSVSASSISLPKEQFSLQRANEIRKSIIDGDLLFEDAAREYSVDMYAEMGGNAGEIFYYDILPDFSDEAQLNALFSASANTITDPLESNFAYIIYQIHESVSEADPTDPASISAARSYLQQFERGRIADFFEAEAERLAAAAQASDLASASSELGYNLHETDFFAKNYGSLPYFSSVPSNQPLGTVNTSMPFFEAVFGTPLLASSAPVILQDRILVVSPVEERQAQNAEMLESFYPNFAQQAKGEQLETILLDPEHITDNFLDILFSRIIQL
ncbi:peptidylprolyl isomerase [Spirochaeta dissipatitropha]